MRLVMPLITDRDVNKHEWECDWVSEVLYPFFPSPTSCSVRVGWVVVVVASCGGTDSGE